MKKKRIIVTVFAAILVLGIGLVTRKYVNSENALLKDKTFIICGESYYAVETMEKAYVSFFLVDTKNILEAKDVQYEGEIYSNDEQVESTELDNVEFRLLNEYSSYSVYLITCTLDSENINGQSGKYNYLKVYDRQEKSVFDLPIGQVIVEKVEYAEPCEQVDIGCFFYGYKGEYYINVTNNTEDDVIIKEVHFLTGEKGEPQIGEWKNQENVIGAGISQIDVVYQYETDKEIMYLQPIVTYTMGGKLYSEIANIPTSYLKEIDKNYIMNYIEEKVEEWK